MNQRADPVTGKRRHVRGTADLDNLLGSMDYVFRSHDSSQNGEKSRIRLVFGQRGVDFCEKSVVCIEFDQGGSLLVIDFQTVLCCLKRIVGTLVELAAAMVADTFLFRLGKEFVEVRLAGFAGETGSQSLDQEIGRASCRERV